MQNICSVLSEYLYLGHIIFYVRGFLLCRISLHGWNILNMVYFPRMNQRVLAALHHYGYLQITGSPVIGLLDTAFDITYPSLIFLLRIPH